MKNTNENLIIEYADGTTYRHNDVRVDLFMNDNVINEQRTANVMYLQMRQNNE